MIEERYNVRASQVAMLASACCLTTKETAHLPAVLESEARIALQGVDRIVATALSSRDYRGYLGNLCFQIEKRNRCPFCFGDHDGCTISNPACSAGKGAALLCTPMAKGGES